MTPRETMLYPASAIILAGAFLLGVVALGQPEPAERPALAWLSQSTSSVDANGAEVLE